MYIGLKLSFQYNAVLVAGLPHYNEGPVYHAAFCRLDDLLSPNQQCQLFGVDDNSVLAVLFPLLLWQCSTSTLLMPCNTVKNLILATIYAAQKDLLQHRNATICPAFF